MAVTVAIGDAWVAGTRKARAITVTWDSSYVTAGEAVTLAQLRLARAVSSISPGVARNSSGDTYLVSWDGSVISPKLIASRADQVDDAGEQVPNATDLSGFTSRHVVFGT